MKLLGQLVRMQSCIWDVCHDEIPRVKARPRRRPNELNAPCLSPADNAPHHGEHAPWPARCDANCDIDNLCSMTYGTTGDRV